MDFGQRKEVVLAEGVSIQEKRRISKRSYKPKTSVIFTTNSAFNSFPNYWKPKYNSLSNNVGIIKITHWGVRILQNGSSSTDDFTRHHHILMILWMYDHWRLGIHTWYLRWRAFGFFWTIPEFFRGISDVCDWRWWFWRNNSYFHIRWSLFMFVRVNLVDFVMIRIWFILFEAKRTNHGDRLCVTFSVRRS